MAKKNTEKKENKILSGIIMIIVGIIFFSLASQYDMVLFGAINIDGDIAYRVLGALSFLIGVLNLVNGIKEKKAAKEKQSDAQQIPEN